LAETKHCIGLLFVAWACFIASIMAVILAMRKAQLSIHRDAVETVNNLERFSQMSWEEAAVQRATFSVPRNKPVAWLNRIAVFGFVLGVVFLCWFVGSNLLADR
jgi:uncharacterized membrane protein YccC